MLKTLFVRCGEYYKSPFDRLTIRPSVRMLQTDFRFCPQIWGGKKINFFVCTDRALSSRHFWCALARQDQRSWPFENPSIRSDSRAEKPNTYIPCFIKFWHIKADNIATFHKTINLWKLPIVLKQWFWPLWKRHALAILRLARILKITSRKVEILRLKVELSGRQIGNSR